MRLKYIGHRDSVTRVGKKVKYFAERNGEVYPEVTDLEVIKSFLVTGKYYPIVKGVGKAKKLYCCPFCNFTTPHRVGIMGHLKKHDTEIRGVAVNAVTEERVMEVVKRLVTEQLHKDAEEGNKKKKENKKGKTKA